MSIRKILAGISVIVFSAVTWSSVSADVNFKFASANAPYSMSHGAFGHAWKKHIEEASNGRITVQLLFGGQMGSEQDNVNQVSSGLIQAASAAVNNVTPFAPIVGFATLPYMFQGVEEAWAVFDSPLRDTLNETMAKQANFRTVAWLTGGFRVLSNSKKPVRTLADLQGLRIRVPKNDIMIASYKAWGINPVPMSWTETFNALQQKVVDGQDNPYDVFPTLRFDEVQSYITNIHYILWSGPVIVNEVWWQNLSADDQSIISEAAVKAQDEQRAGMQSFLGGAALFAIEHGVEITPPADEQEWVEPVMAIWPDFYEKIGGKAFVDEVVVFLENHRKSN